jgi:hypothetical protein
MHLFISNFCEVFYKDIPFHWPSLVMANEKEADTIARDLAPSVGSAGGMPPRHDWQDTGSPGAGAVAWDQP